MVITYFILSKQAYDQMAGGGASFLDILGVLLLLLLIEGLYINLTNVDDTSKPAPSAVISVWESERTGLHANTASTFHRDGSDLRHPATVDKI